MNKFIKGVLESVENCEALCEEESAKHIVRWIPKEELATFLNIKNNIYVLSELENGAKAYILEQGKMINSHELDRLDVIGARNIVKGIMETLNAI